MIDKQALKVRASQPPSPYDIALGLGLAKVHDFLKVQGQHKVVSHVIVEKRGINEDRDLELAFRRVCDGENGHALEAHVHVAQYVPGIPNVMGQTKFDLQLTGTLAGNKIPVNAIIPGTQMRLMATLTKRHELPVRG